MHELGLMNVDNTHLLALQGHAMKKLLTLHCFVYAFRLNFLGSSAIRLTLLG